MIRRALTPTLAALTLTAALAACTGGPGGSGGQGTSAAEDIAVQFMTAYVSGDEAAACELADREIGDCTTRPANEFASDPEPAGTFENEETGTTAVIVNYTTTTNDDPAAYVVEVKEDGKVTEWEDMSGQPKNRETVVMELGWSQ